MESSEKNKYLKMLVEEFHSAVVATIGRDGFPQTRMIDMMLWDREGVYFLTARGKEFYRQLMEQKFIAVSAGRDKKAVSVRGRIRNIGSWRLDEIFEKNVYMQEIYPEGTRDVLEVFQLYEALGEYFDISVPSRVVRERFTVGNLQEVPGGYEIDGKCVGCGKCQAVCPQKCIDIQKVPAVIDQNRCLHCGRCADRCPVKAIVRRQEESRWNRRSAGDI